MPCFWRLVSRLKWLSWLFSELFYLTRLGDIQQWFSTGGSWVDFYWVTDSDSKKKKNSKYFFQSQTFVVANYGQCSPIHPFSVAACPIQGGGGVWSLSYHSLTHQWWLQLTSIAPHTEPRTQVPEVWDHSANHSTTVPSMLSRKHYFCVAVSTAPAFLVKHIKNKLNKSK